LNQEPRTKIKDQRSKNQEQESMILFKLTPNIKYQIPNYLVPEFINFLP